MSKFTPHRLWLSALVAAIALMAGSDPLLSYAHDVLSEKQSTLTTTGENLATTLRQLREDATTAQQLSQSIDESEIEKYLAPADRVRAAALLEPLAATAHFSAFTYNLSPEHPAKPNGIESGDVAESMLLLDGNAPHDLAIRDFFQNMREQFPGRLQIKSLHIERLSANNAAQLTIANLRFHAEVQWLSNGQKRTADSGSKAVTP